MRNKGRRSSVLLLISEVVLLLFAISELVAGTDNVVGCIITIAGNCTIAIPGTIYSMIRQKNREKMDMDNKTHGVSGDSMNP